MRRLNTRAIRTALLAACALLGTAAHAGLCSVGGSSLSFGGLDGSPSAGRTTTGSITVTCLGLASTTSYRIGITGNAAGRGMVNLLGGANLTYNLYLDSNYTRVWADTAGAQATGSLSPNGLLPATATHTVYGKLDTQQGAIRPGLFGDTLSINITYDP